VFRYSVSRDTHCSDRREIRVAGDVFVGLCRLIVRAADNFANNANVLGRLYCIVRFHFSVRHCGKVTSMNFLAPFSAQCPYVVQ